MAYADLLTIQTLNVGDILTAACMMQVRDNGEFQIDPPAFSVYGTGAQSVPDTTATAMLADAEYFDNAAWHSTSSNTSRATATTGGRHLMFATGQFAADVDGVRNLKFRVNGTTSYEAFQVAAFSAVNSVVITAVKALTLSVGDWVEVMAFHTAGAALNVTLLEFGGTFLTR